MVECVRAEMLRELKPSPDGVDVLRPLRVSGYGTTSECGLHLVAEILDEDVQEVAVLMAKIGIAHALRPQFTSSCKHGHQ